MTRITTPDNLFFPVSTQPIFTTSKGIEISIPNRMAVINHETNKVLGVVSRDYQLITNMQAVQYARECAKAIFPDTDENEWEIFSADAPQSGIYCHIDLRHNTGKLEFNYVMIGTREDVPEAYGPYIRVTNSYNAQRALKFTIGYHRKICKNGLTQRRNVVSFSFSHTRDSIQTNIEFVVDHKLVQKNAARIQRFF